MQLLSYGRSCKVEWKEPEVLKEWNTLATDMLLGSKLVCVQVFYFMYPRLFQRLEHSSMKGRLLHHSKNADLLCDSGIHTRVLWQSRRAGWGGRWEEIQEGGAWVYWWLVLVEVWQKATKFCKANILKLKKKVAKKLDKIYCAAIHLGHLIVCCLCPDVSISTEIALTLGILNMLTWQLMNFARTYTFQIKKNWRKLIFAHILVFIVSGGSDSKESVCNVADLGLIPGLRRSPGEGSGNPLQYSCLENSMDRGAWWAIVHGVAKSLTWLSDWHTQYNLTVNFI